jgi:hypothetical protein
LPGLVAPAPWWSTRSDHPDGQWSAFTDAVLADVDRAAAVRADEMQISLNLVTPVSPDRQRKLVGTL